MGVALSTLTREQTLTMLALAGGRGGCFGVDLGTGAFVMAQWPGGAACGLTPYDMAVAHVADEQEVQDPGRPEAVMVERPPHAVGRLRRRPAERFLRPLLLPARTHLLGFAASSVPYWTLTGDRPSICLAEPDGGVVVTADRTCRFLWRGAGHDLPLAETALPAGMLAGSASGAFRGRPRLAGAALAEVLGYVPRRVLVALSPPRDGLCHKVAVSLLP
jgi:hypothetical protein